MSFCGNRGSQCQGVPTKDGFKGCYYHKVEYPKILDKQLEEYIREEKMDIIKMIIGFGIFISACAMAIT